MQTIPTRTLTAQDDSEAKIPVGISACLLGKPVRYNGGHSQSRLCLGELSEHFHYRSFCPELEAGFGVPRPTLRLSGDPSDPRMVFSNDTGKDVTDRFRAAVTPVVETLDDLDGYILMKNSPSCGLERVKVYQENGYPHTERTEGLFTGILRERYPDLPVEEEGRLNDARLRENFILRVFAHHQFRHQVDREPSVGRLMAFHRDYKYVLMAHSQTEYRDLGRLLARARKQDDLEALRDTYKRRFMAAIARPASRRNHCNVLLHLLGYLKRALDGATRRDIITVIEQYRRGEVNLATPMALVNHYVRRFGNQYIKGQRYLEPYPARLGLTNQL